MGRVDIYGVDTKDIITVIALQNQRVHEAALVKIEAIYLVSGSRKEGIARRKVIC
jgi:hypothetical protein